VAARATKQLPKHVAERLRGHLHDLEQNQADRRGEEGVLERCVAAPVCKKVKHSANKASASAPLNQPQVADCPKKRANLRESEGNKASIVRPLPKLD
jgi:hypothetical protein